MAEVISSESDAAEGSESSNNGGWRFRGSKPENREEVRRRVKERAEETNFRVRDLFPSVTIDDGTLTVRSRKQHD
jgi:hypothetical protein